MDRRRATGQQGEAIAKAYLREKGWTILDTNWRSRLGELDLVAIAPNEPYLVIVEVRTRRSHRYGTAAESVNFRKQQRVRRLGLQYAQKHRLLHKPLRFDVVTVNLPRNATQPQISHIVAAF